MGSETIVSKKNSTARMVNRLLGWTTVMRAKIIVPKILVMIKTVVLPEVTPNLCQCAQRRAHFRTAIFSLVIISI